MQSKIFVFHALEMNLGHILVQCTLSLLSYYMLTLITHIFKICKHLFIQRKLVTNVHKIEPKEDMNTSTWTEDQTSSNQKVDLQKRTFLPFKTIYIDTYNKLTMIYIKWPEQEL
jgi:hypothetical protein